MGEQLSINSNEVKQYIQNLVGEMNIHCRYQCKPFESDLMNLESMNTDFIAQFKTMLGDMNDNDRKLAQEYTSIVETASEILENFNEIDEMMCTNMEAMEEETDG